MGGGEGERWGEGGEGEGGGKWVEGRYKGRIIRGRGDGEGGEDGGRVMKVERGRVGGGEA